MNRILRGRIERFCSHYHGPLFHALLCDPPYHLTSITARFGKAGSAPAKYGKDGAFARASAGFMGQKWDGGDVAFDPDTWAAMATLLYPGAFGMAFASSRGSHRLACAIEDAGLIIHPQIGWCYGSGFPKATRIDTQIDRDAGAEREVVASDRPQYGINKTRVEHGYRPNEVKNGSITLPSTPLAQIWQGHRYGLQAMKPALEPIIVFQKPYQGRPVDSITATGAGALNVDGARVGLDTGRGDRYNGKSPKGGTGYGGYSQMEQWKAVTGRWPSNLILHCSCDPARPDKDDHAPGCAVRMVGEQSGESESKGGYKGKSTGSLNGWGYKADFEKHPLGFGDEGTAARFFFQSDWSYEIAERLAMAEPVRYEAKASRAERDAGLEGFEYGRVGVGDGNSGKSGRRTAGDGVTPIDDPVGRNPHPTIKPISLCKYLASLLLPPAAYAPRRILTPFAGVASEMIGAVLAGWGIMRILRRNHRPPGRW